MKRILTATVCGLVLTAALPQAGLAQGNGKGKGHNKQADQDDENRDRDSDRGGKRGARIVFSVRDRDTIRDYYQDRNSNLPPGLAKRNGNLPPGLQKHLERDGTLPPGLQKRVQPFPEDLERRLPPLPDTYRRVTLGVDILILDRRTQRIVDVIHDILRP
ncbi:MAG: hypothetical protein ACXV7C_12815 [Candidatus Angelobacter sp.]